MYHFWWIVDFASEDTAEDMFCSATLLIERMGQDDEFDMVGSENDDDNGRVWTESTLSRNFVLKRWLLLCHFIQLHRARDCEETWGFLGCFDA